MSARKYNVEFIDLAEDDLSVPPESRELSAGSNSEARKIFKISMRESFGAIEHKDYLITSIRLAGTPSTLDLTGNRKGISKKDADKALKHLKKGGDVQIDVWKDLKSVHLIPDVEEDRNMSLAVSEVWDDTAQIATVIQKMGGNINPERDLEELDSVLLDHGVTDSYEMIWFYNIPDDGEQLNEIIQYAIADFDTQNKKIFADVVAYFKDV